mmetsp:Transcript_57146/g.121489  ORF Transcript_57146/g.121489 Transcript_57146/m.121489 type:complete len:536 (+) Transcript_57146:346-1953(+)|eukprot:CAMPEP_0206425646 /NCGR_PEP_ID=MMETSP0324_2-20121206/3912_1 /ASSEMBLY_ACC=CAM_ASM_000836 /TAXON_ID=2866 /ORGANISM="Crypthecodinium cohnii, Strain Seligo" /LENGTH=535 /DNA_ID=CAMNT_0053890461 /DNA_START=286 /DNA_END=1893 /DNA_ORIENTATION=+
MEHLRYEDLKLRCQKSFLQARDVAAWGVERKGTWTIDEETSLLRQAALEVVRREAQEIGSETTRTAEDSDKGSMREAMVPAWSEDQLLAIADELVKDALNPKDEAVIPLGHNVVPFEIEARSPKASEERFIQRLTRTHRVGKCLLLLGCPLVAWICITLQEPYFANWATTRGMDSGQAGIVIGSSPILTLVAGVLAPLLSRRYGTKSVLTGSCCLLCITFVGIACAPAILPVDYLFVPLLFLFSLAGVGEGIMEMNSNVVILEDFPDMSGRLLGLAEGSVGVGSIVGPAIGGGGYDLGGFALPPLIASTIALVLGLFSAWSLRNPKKEQGGAEEDSEPDSEIEWEPNIVVFCSALAGTFWVGATTSAFEPLASIYAKQSLGWTTSKVGWLLCAYGVTYSLVSIVAGKYNDANPQMPRRCFAGGAFVSVLSSLLSSGYLTAGNEHVGLIAGALGFGVADSLLLVPSLLVLTSCVPGRWKDDNLLVSIDQSVFALGCGLGPMVFLPLGDLWGFESTMLVLALISMVLGCTTYIVFKL